MKSSRRLLTLVLLAAAALVSYLWVARSSSGESLEAGPDLGASRLSEQTGMQAPTAPAVPAPAAARTTVSPTVRAEGPSESNRGTVESIASSFYGDDWERIRPELEKRISLATVPDIQIPPWESVLDEVRRAMHVTDLAFSVWRLRYAPPEPVTLDYLVKRFTPTDLPLDERDVAAIEAFLVEPRAELQERLERLRALCNDVLAVKFSAGQYNYGPFASIHTDKLPKAAFYSDSTAVKGWSVSWGIEASEHPEFPAMLEELVGLKKRIRDDIQRYLDGRH